MGTTDSNTPILEVPVDDGSIASAIDSLDGMISDWATAMDAAQRVVAQVATREARSEAAAPPGHTNAATQNDRIGDAPAEPKAGVIKLSRKPSTAPRAEGGKQPQAGGEESEVVSVQRAKSAGTASSRVHAAAFDQPGAIEPLVKPIAAEPVAPVPDPEVERLAAHEEDEALLATLSPSVAKALKIKRRLSNGKKSIRQLLAEG